MKLRNGGWIAGIALQSHSDSFLQQPPSFRLFSYVSPASKFPRYCEARKKLLGLWTSKVQKDAMFTNLCFSIAPLTRPKSHDQPDAESIAPANRYTILRHHVWPPCCFMYGLRAVWFRHLHNFHSWQLIPWDPASCPTVSMDGMSPVASVAGTEVVRQKALPNLLCVWNGHKVISLSPINNYVQNKVPHKNDPSVVLALVWLSRHISL